MKELFLKRVSSNIGGVFGVLESDYQPFAVTYELPWKDNKNNISCIPSGIYVCKSKISPSKGFVYELQDVLDRDYIYMHKGNFSKDTLGCILVGEYFEGAGIAMSGKGFDELVSKYGQDEDFKLIITSNY